MNEREIYPNLTAHYVRNETTHLMPKRKRNRHYTTRAMSKTEQQNSANPIPNRKLYDVVNKSGHTF